jgi:uncharacterized protein (DUF1800 family)
MLSTMRRAQLLHLTLALQAAVAAAACSYDRSRPHPLTNRRTQIAHLLRRAGFGASREELDEYVALGLTKTIERLVEFEQVADDAEDRLRMISLDLNKLADLQRSWLLRMIYTKRPLQEKMVLFWHGLLTSAAAKVGLPNPTPQNPNPPHYLLDQHKFFREHAVDTFENILLGISRDPAMMIWLDSQVNNKGKPNENYARELMELFSLGITGPDGKPNYTEQDVREVARAFTGWGIEQGRFVFRPSNHDTGLKTVLGKTGNFDGNDVIKLLVQQPAAAWHLSCKLWEFFAYDNPSEADLQPLITAYIRTGGSVKAMLRALFTSPAFYSPRAYRAKIKSPVEFTVGIVRALKIATDAFPLPGATTRMGQALFNPPNVAGWPGGIAWINSTTWLERINFCNTLLTARNDSHTMPPPLETIVQRYQLSTHEAIVDHFADLLLDGQISSTMRAALLDYLAAGQPVVAIAGRPRAIPSGPALPAFVDQKVRGVVYLLLASPEFQLA